MATPGSVDFVLELLREKHAALVNGTEALIRMLASENVERKKQEGENVLALAQELARLIPEKRVPEWLKNLIGQLNQFVGGTWKAPDLLVNVIPQKQAMHGHQWSFDTPLDESVDFEAIFKKFRDESRLPDLFDEIIRILKLIQASGEIDSVSMMNALGRIIASVQKAKEGSYLTINGVWGFMMAFLNNYVWGQLSSLPAIGPAVAALEKTLKETAIELDKVQKEFEAEATAVVQQSIRHPLNDLSVFQLPLYSQRGLTYREHPPLLSQKA